MLCLYAVRCPRPLLGCQHIFLHFNRVVSPRLSSAVRQLSLSRSDHFHTPRWLLFGKHQHLTAAGCILRGQRCFSTGQPVSGDAGRLIYTGSLGKAVLGVKFFSYSSSMFSLCVAPYLLLKTGLGVQSLAAQVAFFSVIGFFTFLTPALLHLITKGYVLRLYHNAETDRYAAVTCSALLVEKVTRFHQKDVKVPDVSKMFTSFYANKHAMLVNPELFSMPHDYNHLMGYDRPFLFDLDDLKKTDKS